MYNNQIVKATGENQASTYHDRSHLYLKSLWQSLLIHTNLCRDKKEAIYMEMFKKINIK